MPKFMEAIDLKIKGNIFSEEELKLANLGRSEREIHNYISYYLKTKKILKLKRGLYCLSSNAKKISAFNIANILYDPSYVSFESALSFYNIIPEAVYETTSACYQSKKKLYETFAGNFSYSHIPIRPFFLDVTKSEHSNFLIAKPIRALFDLIYLRKVKYEKISDLEDDLRIDRDEISHHMKEYLAKEIDELASLYNKPATRNLAKILIKEFK